MAYRSTGTVGTVDGTSVGSGQGLGMPAGMTAGDVLILQCLSRAAAATIATPSGWLAHPSVSTLAFTNTHRQSWFYRVAVGSDAIPTVTQDVSGLLLCSISAFSGRDTTTIFDVTPGVDGNVDALTFAAESIAPVTAGCDVLWLFSTEDDNSLGSASQGTLAYARQTTTGADGSQALVYRTVAAAEPSGSCSLTQAANGPDNWVSFTIALRPAAVAVTSPATALFDDILFDVDVAFGAGPFTPSPTWTRVTEYLNGVVPVVIFTGRQSEDGAVNPGTCHLALNNSITSAAGRRFDPDYAAGPYFGQLNLRTPIRVWARRDGTNHPLFTGLVRSWRQIQVAGSRDGYTEVQAIDVSSLLANIPTPSTALHLAVLADQPEVYLPMDEEKLGHVTDASGNGWIGTYGSSVTIPDSIVRAQTGRKSKALTLVGLGTGLDGIIAIMTANTTPETIRSLEAWVKVTAYDAATAAVTGLVQPFEITVQGVSSGLRIAAVVTGFPPGPIQKQWLVYVIDASGTPTVGWSAEYVLGVTHHVAVVLSDTYTTASLYLDGALVGASDVSGLTFEGGSETPYAYVQVSSDESAGTVAHVAGYRGSLTAADISRHHEAGLLGGHQQTAAERLDILAEYAGLTDAGLWDSSSMGAHTFLSAADFDGSVLDEMRKIMDAEQGRMFVNGMGVLTAQSRVTDIAPLEPAHVTSAGTYGDSAPAEIRYEDWNREPATEDLLRNVITVNGIEVRDHDSVTQYGPAAEEWAVPIASPGAARAFGRSRLRRYATPAPRVDRLTVNMRGHPDAELDTAQNTTLGLRLGHRVTATIRPADGLGDDIVEAVRVEGRQDVITPHTWVTDLYTVPAGDSYSEGPFYTIGHATYGRIGASAGNGIPG